MLKESPINGSEIAIIGMAGRFPGANNIDRFWSNLQTSVESISGFTDEELLKLGCDREVINQNNYVKAGAILEDVELFDANFFNFNPREAEITDPQQRLFLESAWEALENAGYNGELRPSGIGIFAGASLSDYLFNIYDRYRAGELDEDQLLIAVDKDFLTTRVSYKLNLEGPSYTVQTACSTSLVAVHLACQSLLNGECDLALAGGVSINGSRQIGYFYTEGGIASPDGHCRAFDAKAQGTVSGEGVGIVVLKRLAEALSDRDSIHAIIKGSAINNDGGDKVSYSAPRIDSQAKVIRTAQAIAEVEPETITYIEAHGTGTALGDPIEIAALTQAFQSDRRNFCAIGAVKTNIGHLDAAAGVAGLIKTVLALKHRQIPPSLHFEEPNPLIDFANSPFYVNTKLAEWQANGIPRRAGVSSFGVGGTNVHVVLEESEKRARRAKREEKKSHLLIISAKTSSALDAATENLVAHLQQHPDLNLADVAYTLQVGRRNFDYRRIAVCQNVDDAVQTLSALIPQPLLPSLGEGGQEIKVPLQQKKLPSPSPTPLKKGGRGDRRGQGEVGEGFRVRANNPDPQRVSTHYEAPSHRPVAFMFSPQGAQYVNMAAELYQQEPTFTNWIDRCAEELKTHLRIDLRTVLYSNDDASEELRPTAIAQPALFAIEYALAQLWLSWGVLPTAAIGHSIGEYVAATIAGVFSLEDALALVATRGRLMQQLPAGAMLSVALSEEEVRGRWGDGEMGRWGERERGREGERERGREGEREGILNSTLNTQHSTLSIAAINAPNSCVVSGTEEAIAFWEQQLQAEGISCRRLHTSHAFHSSMMAPIVKPFTEAVAKIQLNPPKIPFLSNVTGTWITAEQATDPRYWAQHLREPVRFSAGVAQLLQNPQQILLEVGPGRTLSTFAKQHQSDNSRILTSLRHPQEQESDVAFLLNTLGRLWLLGVSIDWLKLWESEQPSRIPLPTYPFERQRYWIDSKIPTVKTFGNEKRDINDWFYVPVWQESIAFKFGSELPRWCWLVFLDRLGLGAEVAQRLEKQGQKVVTVRMGEKFDRLDDSSYAIDPGKPDDYHTLMQTLRDRQMLPQAIAHFGGVGDDELDLGFYSLLFLTQAIAKENITDPLKLMVVTSNVHDVTGEERIYPQKATILGICQVIRQEYPNITCCCLDVSLPELNTHNKIVGWVEQSETQHPGNVGFRDRPNLISDKQIDRLMRELFVPPTENAIAYRGNRRWVQYFEPVRLNTSETLQCNVSTSLSQIPRLRAGGVYLITGGLGGIGLVLAEYLARQVQAKLILIGRSWFPPREEWSNYQLEDGITTKIAKIRELEALGSEVLVIRADVADRSSMNDAIALATECFGEIHGVIHAAHCTTQPETISEISKAQCDRQFQAKVRGTLVLETLFRGQKLDFCILMSSLSSILGGLGFAAYAAANSFMDAFAQQQNQIGDFPWFAINWDGWELPEEMAVETAATQTKSLGMTPEEGVEAFQRILSLPEPTQVIVSTGDLSARMKQWLKPESLPKEDFGSDYPRPNLQNSYVAPRNELEEAIALIWGKLLGIAEIGIHDNFFDLGGDSLLATQVVAQLRQSLQVEVSLREFFQRPTIADVALALAAGEKTSSNPIMRVDRGNSSEVLAQVDRLSDRDVEGLLQELLAAKNFE
jgi:acyl transferase domain-containing protein/acyl carrier protein